MSAGSDSGSVFRQLADNRRQVARALAAVGLVLVCLAVWWGMRGWPAAAKDDADSKPAAKAEDKAKTPEPPKPAAGENRSTDYLPAAIWAGLLALTCFGSAAWMATQPIAGADPVTTVRTELVVFGSTIGFLTALLGLAFGIGWRQSLFEWVNHGQASEARWVLIAACIFTAGLIIMFGTLQLARTQERASAALRRALYGFNAVFLGLLLAMVLMAVNVISFLELPNTLVTNDSAFVELSEPSKKFLRSLDQPVHVYLVMPENYSPQVDIQGVGTLSYKRLYADCRGMLSQCERQSRFFHATYLSPALDAVKHAELMDRLKVPTQERTQFGMWITVGDHEDVNSFIPVRELIEIVELERSILAVFQGENRLMTELTYLTDSRSKEVVYVTQANGELQMDLAGGGGGRRSMAGLARFLGEKKMKLAPLVLADANAKVPDDAAAVLVPGPQRTITADSPLYKALAEYVHRPAPRPGKVVAFLPAFRSEASTKVAPTGLEPLLGEFGIDLSGDQRILAIPRQFRPLPGLGFIPPNTVVGEPAEDVPVTLERALGQPLLFQNARAVRTKPGGTTFRAIPLMSTSEFPPGTTRNGFWMDDDFATNPESTAVQILTDPQQRQKLIVRPIPLMVAVTEGAPAGGRGADKPRLLVFASDTVIDDRPAYNAVPDQYRYQVVSDSLDWLREREASLGIPPKKQASYQVTNPASLQSLLLLVGLVLAGISAGGVAVWLARRR